MKEIEYCRDAGYQKNVVRDLLECGRSRAFDKDVWNTRKVFKLFVGGHGRDFVCEREAIREILPEVCRLSQMPEVFNWFSQRLLPIQKVT
jgi:hypothetical protein